MKNQKGFIMTLFLLSVPLFIICLMVLTTLIFCIRNHDKAQSYCLHYSLQAQEHFKRSLKKLLSLNPKAKILRKKHKVLKKWYQKALSVGEPISISVLKVKLRVIKQQRKLLDIKQKQILSQSTQHIESVFKTFKQKIKTLNAKQITKKHHYPFPLAVSAYPKWDIAPVYRPKKRFSQNQALTFYWKMPLYHFLPTWLIKIFFEETLSFYYCSATIKKQKRGWNTTLTT